MEPVHVKEALSFPDKVHLQYGLRHYYLFKETNINFNYFSLQSLFYNIFMM